jgi:hypothetical protein
MYRRRIICTFYGAVDDFHTFLKRRAFMGGGGGGQLHKVTLRTSGGGWGGGVEVRNVK